MRLFSKIAIAYKSPWFLKRKDEKAGDESFYVHTATVTHGMEQLLCSVQSQKVI